MNHSAVVHRTGSLIYAAIVVVQRKQPELLVQKYRWVDWEHPVPKAKLLRKLFDHLNAIAAFSETSSLETAFPDLERLLKVFFVPDFFESATYGSLLQRLQLIVPFPVPLQPSAPPVQHSDTLATDSSITSSFASASIISTPTASASIISASTASPSSTNASISWVQSTEAIGILLLDAENIRLSEVEEQFLQQQSRYPLQLKIAFADWRNVSRAQAVRFHRRSYQMIHVPSGKNSADMKMTAIGSSLFIHYPNIKEVLVCSCDQDLFHLRNTLQAYGLVVYTVRKHAELLTLTNPTTGQTATLPLAPIRPTPTQKECVDYLKEIVREEQQATSTQWISLSRVSFLFHSRHGLTLAEVSRLYSTGNRARDFLAEHPQDFVLYQYSRKDSVYICLYEDYPSEEDQEEEHLEDDQLEEKQIEDGQNAGQSRLRTGDESQWPVQACSVQASPVQTAPIAAQALVNPTVASTSLNESAEGAIAPSAQTTQADSEAETAATASTKVYEPLIESRAQLEAELIKIVQQLSEKSEYKAGYVAITKLHSQFQKRYGEPMKHCLKRLKINQRYIKFLETCSAFKVRKMDEEWQITLANP